VDPLSSDIGSVDLAEYLRRLRRRWWAVVLAIALGIAGGLVLTNALDEQYVSETSVLVLPVDMDAPANIAGGRTSGDINLDTEAQIVRSASVAAAVSDQLDGAIPAAELMGNVAVTVPPNSQVLRLTYTADTAERAQAGARAYADVYLKQRAAAVRERIDGASESLKEQRAERQEQLVDVTDRIAELFVDSSDRQLAESERDILISQLSSINDQLSALRIAAAPAGRVITEANLPQRPSAPNAMLNVAGGVLLGLVLGVAAAVAIDRYDRRIRRANDVRRARFGVIGEIGRRRHLAVSLDLGADDQVDRIRNRLVSYAGNAKVVQVVPGSTRHSCGLVGAALAASFAREYGRALYVVATSNGPVAALLGPGGPGLTEALEGALGVSDLAVWSRDLPRVSIVGPGQDASRLGQLLQPTAAATLLDEAQARFPVVVVESGSVSDSASAQAVARSADVVVVVAERGVADTRSLQATGDDLSNLHARLAGVIVAPRVRMPRHRPEGAAPRTESAADRPNADRPDGDRPPTDAPNGDGSSADRPTASGSSGNHARRTQPLSLRE
jgi:capsular polysaccharide biosynthesis protein/Mrp family chromosome partitioning ATPase